MMEGFPRHYCKGPSTKEQVFHVGGVAFKYKEEKLEVLYLGQEMWVLVMLVVKGRYYKFVITLWVDRWMWI